MASSSRRDALEMDDEQLEESIVILRLDGVLNAEAVYKSVQNGGVGLRMVDTGKPVIQVR